MMDGIIVNCLHDHNPLLCKQNECLILFCGRDWVFNCPTEPLEYLTLVRREMVQCFHQNRDFYADLHTNVFRGFGPDMEHEHFPC